MNNYQDAFYFLSFLPTILDFRHRLRHCHCHCHCLHYSLVPLTSDYIFKDPGSIYQAPGHLELFPSSAESSTSLKIDDYSIATPLRWKVKVKACTREPNPLRLVSRASRYYCLP